MVFEDFWIVNFLRRICKLLFRNDLDGLAYLEGSGSHEDDLLASLQPRFDLYIVAGAKAEFDGPMLNLAIDYYAAFGAVGSFNESVQSPRILVLI